MESAPLLSRSSGKPASTQKAENFSMMSVVAGAVIVANLFVIAAVIPYTWKPVANSPSMAAVLEGKGVEQLSIKSAEQKAIMWGVFKHTYGKFYESEQEEQTRFGNFLKNLERIDEMNFASPHATFGITAFADIDHAAYISAPSILETDHFLSQLASGADDGTSALAKSLGYSPTINEEEERDLGSLPDSWDWRDFNKVTEVKNIGTTCEASWAVTAVEDLEGSWAIDNDIDAIPLSVQEVASCEKPDTDDGCAPGGEPSHAFGFMIHVNGVESQEEYPIEIEEDTETMPECKTDDLSSFTNSASIESWEVLKSSSNTQVKGHLVDIGPLAVMLNRNQILHYTGGIDVASDCDASHLNHSMLLVGYNKDESGKLYWILKGSYGASWGDDGYYKIYASDGACGVTKLVTHSRVMPLEQPRPNLGWWE